MKGKIEYTFDIPKEAGSVSVQSSDGLSPIKIVNNKVAIPVHDHDKYYNSLKLLEEMYGVSEESESEPVTEPSTDSEGQSEGTDEDETNPRIAELRSRIEELESYNPRNEDKIEAKEIELGELKTELAGLEEE